MQITVNALIRVIIFILGLVTTVIVFISNNSVPYTQFLIPLTYSVSILIFPQITKYILSYIGILALNICMFLRYLVSPLLTSIDTTYISTSIIPTTENYSTAVNLMLYEMIIIFIIIIIFSKYFYSNSELIDLKNQYNITGWIYTLFCLFLILLFPELLSRYSFVLTANQLESKDLNIEILSVIPLLLQLGSLVLMISILNMLYKKFKTKKKLAYLVLSVLSVLLISSFIIGTSRFSLILPLVSGLFIVFLLYKQYRRIVGFISIASIFLFMVITTLLKNRTLTSSSEGVGSVFADLGTDLQLYFSGITNVATAVQTNGIYGTFNSESIFADIFRSVIFINSFFTSQESALEAFNITFYNGGVSRDQILPMIGQGYLYFGFFLAPLFTIITLFILMYLDKKTKNSNTIFIKFVFIYATLKVGLFMMTNFTNILSFLTNQVTILLIVFSLNYIFHKRKRITK